VGGLSDQFSGERQQTDLTASEDSRFGRRELGHGTGLVVYMGSQGVEEELRRLFQALHIAVIRGRLDLAGDGQQSLVVEVQAVTGQPTSIGAADVMVLTARWHFGHRSRHPAKVADRCSAPAFGNGGLDGMTQVVKERLRRRPGDEATH
jgi:hypothetical protein